MLTIIERPELEKYKIDVVLCNGLGRRAVEALNFEGIRTVGTDITNLTEALKLLADDKLSDIDPARACHGHGQKIEIEQSIACNDRHPMLGKGRGRQQGSRQGRRNQPNG